MTAPHGLAVAAFAAFVLAAALPRRATFLLAATVGALAAALRVDGSGAGIVALVAASAAVLSHARGADKHRISAVFAVGCSAVGLLSVPSQPAMHGGPLGLAMAAPVLALLVLANSLRSRRAHAPLAFLLAVLPFPIAAVAPTQVELAVQLPHSANAWAMSRGLSFSAAQWPAWSDSLWHSGPWLLLTWVLLCLARPSKPMRLGGAALVGFVLLCSAVAQVLGVVDAITQTSSQVRSAAVGSVGAALPLQGSPTFSLAAGATVFLRLVAVVWLLRPAVVSASSSASSSKSSSSSVPTTSLVGADRSGLVAIAAFVMIAATAWIAPAWFGAGWMGDPGVSALLLVALLTTASTLLSGANASRGVGILQAAAASSALLLVGAGELGWRVAGVVFGR